MKGPIVPRRAAIFPWKKFAIALIIPIGIASCTPQSDTTAEDPAVTSTTEPPTTTAEPSTTEPATTEPSATEPPPATPVTTTAVAANSSYCYEKEAGDVHSYGRINIDADNKVSGGIQHDFPAQGGDVGSILISVDGTANGESLDLRKSSFSEYDTVWSFVPGELVDTESVTWEATPQALSVDADTAERISADQLESSDCALVNRAMKRRAGQNSVPLITGYSKVTKTDVQFDAGKFGTTVDGGLVRGEAAMHLLSAQAGQTMTLEARAAGDNAVVHVVSPSGVLLVREKQTASIDLPETGTYEILVSAVRGNTGYDLDIEVQ